MISCEILIFSLFNFFKVVNQKKKEEARAAFSGAKFVPKSLRPKFTKAYRQKLSKEQKGAVTLRTKKKQQNFPMRKYAIKA